MPLASSEREPRSERDLDALLELACACARTASTLLREHFAAPPRDVDTKSGPLDLVSAADTAAETAIRDLLERERPGDGMLGEEGGETPSSTGLRWVVDPLDGTVNFLRRVPHWAVSVACEDADGALVGVIEHPLRGECFTAVRGCGAWLDGVRLEGSSATDVGMATLGGEFSARSDAQAECSRRLLAGVGYVRSYGSTALDLAWAAAGRWDAVYHVRFPSPWDVAAGGLMCREAGLRGERITTGGAAEARLLVAPAALVEPLLALIAG